MVIGSDGAEGTVNPGFDKNETPGGSPAETPGVLAHLHGQEQGNAHLKSHQQLLFAPAPKAVCDQIGLDWWAAVKLYEDGWLSFSPEATPRLDEAQEAELLFVGALVVAGCDRRMLVALLRGLSKPYAYDLHRIYYDWLAHDWRIFPDPHAHPEAVFTEWVEMLASSHDAGTLQGIVELAQDALGRLRKQSSQDDLYPS